MQTENLNEQGRSMVEMLSVLAVIGVLTVVGITGFRQAITKHRANELLNEANKRATVVAGQLSMMGAAQGSLSEFTQNEFAGGTFKTDPITPQNNGTFKIGIDHVPDDVCNQMQSMTGGIIVAITACSTGDDNSILLTYNNDLSASESGSGNSGYARTPLPEDGPTADDGSTCTGERLGECQVCNQGVYIDSDAVCVAKGGGTCVDGVCKMAGCLANGDCKTIDPTNCGNGECYCNFNGNVDSCSGPKQTGKCLLKTVNYKSRVNIGGHEYIVGIGNNLDWWSSKNFCAAYGKRMMTLPEVGCTTTACSSSLLTQIWIAYDNEDRGRTWVLDTRSDCFGYYPRSSGGVDAYAKTDGNSTVICY